MLPEGTNGTGGGGLAVPMAWLCAEFTADEILRAGRLVKSGSLEYRAGRDTLALTVYLCHGTGGPKGSQALPRLDEWLLRTEYGHPWQEWVRERLADRARDGAAGPDLALAGKAWRWLESTELLAADLGDLADLGEPGTPGPRNPARPARPGQPAPSAPPAHPAPLSVDESVQVWTPAWRLGLPLGHLSMHLF
ncbi:hypothetical protein [Streptomyces sp. NPDC000410]|uniref:hypothetical protein n=1 Tax=Streptomyces sp. NPDC000410 TaxID=3154254 RepID=UPI0033202554